MALIQKPPVVGYDEVAVMRLPRLIKRLDEVGLAATLEYEATHADRPIVKRMLTLRMMQLAAETEHSHSAPIDGGRPPMGTDHKIKNTGEDLKGKAKEAYGDATDDESTRAEGKADQAKSDLKQAGENVKDAFK
nr:CsbD family protein [Jiangella endophytica]